MATEQQRGDGRAERIASIEKLLYGQPPTTYRVNNKDVNYLLERLREAEVGFPEAEKDIEDLHSQLLKLKAELAESQKIRGIKQCRIVELENTLADVRGDKNYRKKKVLVDGKLETPVEGDALKQRNAALRGTLQLIEWQGHDQYGNAACYDCQCCKSVGHADHCEIRKALGVE